MNSNQIINPLNPKIKIGIPKSLMYFEHGNLWEAFFKELGCSVITSLDTNKTLLELGVKHCSNETCLPVKVFHGHVLYLKEKCDFIFIPRYISISKNSFCCPKLCGLPDMTTLNLKNLSNVIEIDIDYHNGKAKTILSLEKIAKILNLDLLIVQNIYDTIIENNLKEGIFINLNRDIKNFNKKPVIAVLGHPYVIYDNYLSMNLIDRLLEKGFFVFTPYDNNKIERQKNIDHFSFDVFWEIGYDILASSNIFLENSFVDGIIYLTPFACGIDSVITELIERKIKKTSNKHYMKITLDEHTAEAGFITRLDAFLDMMPSLILK